MILAGMMVPAFAQKVPIPRELQNKAVKIDSRIQNYDNPDQVLSVNRSTFSGILAPSETIIGTSWYDLQSNGSLSNRFSVHPDGTMGAVWTYGIQASAFPDRGTAYNYYNGSNWGSQPTSRIESIRCGWPSYDTWGTAGEINVSHNGTTGLQISKRATRGTGSWTESLFQGPTGITDDPTWPRLVTSGPNNEWIHLVYNSYAEYMGQTTATLYSRSNDGGTTWNPESIILSGMGSTYYNEIGADDYTMAVNGNTVAILLADAWHDLFVMKSTDNGANWTKTVIWEHPYPFFDWNTTMTDTFFCVDNSASVAIGPDNKVHVVFGINRVLHDAAGTTYYYYPYIDGIGYWNEDMPAFSNHIHALAPPSLGYANSEMVVDDNFIGWTQDVNGNGQIDFLDILSYRSLGISTMPSICVDDLNNVFVAFASATETYDNTEYNYRHIWLRACEAGVWSSFLDATSDIVHVFDECIYPVFSQVTDANIYMIYQADVTPGLALDGAHAYQENRIIHSEIPKTDLISYLPQYSITTSSNPSAGGSTTGGGTYLSGANVTVVATSNPNWGFVDWTEDGLTVSTDSSYSFLIDANRTLVANFILEYCPITTTSNPPDGGTTTGDSTYQIGTSATVIATSNPNFTFTDWTENGVTVSTDSSYTFVVDTIRDLVANFFLINCTVTTSADPIGSGTTTGDGLYPNGDSVTVEASPNLGWVFVEWTDSDTVASTDSIYIFEVLTNRDLEANFNPIQCIVATSSEPPEGGTTSGGGTYPYGTIVTITASLNIGWEFEYWMEADTIVSNDSIYTFDVQEDRSFEAHFNLVECIISTLASPPEGGTTSGDGTYAFGDSVTVLAVPNPSWDFVNWSEDGTVVSTSAAYYFQATHTSELIALFDFPPSPQPTAISPQLPALSRTLCKPISE